MTRVSERLVVGAGHDVLLASNHNTRANEDRLRAVNSTSTRPGFVGCGNLELNEQPVGELDVGPAHARS
jgi:hypothetical protein